MSRTRVSTIQNTSGNFSQGVHHIVKGHCGCWVKFNNTGAISADFNCNTVGDNGTGDYTINFSNDFENELYAFAGTHGDGFGGGTSCAFIVPVLANNHLVGSCRVYTKTTSNSGGSAVNFSNHAMIFFYGDI